MNALVAPSPGEEDSHSCLRCRKTIIGLDNYVDHRRNGCYDNLVSANDFFLSLNLVSNASARSEIPFIEESMEDVLSGFLDPLEIENPQGGGKKRNLLSFLKDIEDLDPFEVPSSTGESFPREEGSKCPSCGARVNSFQYGKHLVSHYHYHHHIHGGRGNRDLVLKFIHDIVKEAPYQCQACSFYCNWQTDFLYHWKAAHSLVKALPEHQYFWCSFCRFKTCFPSEMGAHLGSETHSEIVAVINRCVPIIIRLIRNILCAYCPETFRLRISYNKHLIKKHFTEEDAIVNLRDLDEDFKTCEFCPMIVSLKVYKDHVLDNHFSICSQCAMCGARFGISQDLAAHVRNKACCYNFESSKKGDILCKDCSFDCDTLNMLYYHRALKHGQKDECASASVKCPACDKRFPRVKLWQHIKIHGSLNFRCGECYRIFLSSQELNIHMEKHHSKEENEVFKCAECNFSSSKRNLRDLHFNRNHTGSTKSKVVKPYLKDNKCTFCDIGFRTMAELKSHTLSHTSEKPLSCSICQNFRAKRMSEINRHKRLRHENSDSKLKQCSECDYSSHSSQHIQRHAMAAHPVKKKFLQCRLCSFKSSTLENLRKHILKTKKHICDVEVSVYSCDFCSEFKTNSSFQYGKHLSSYHGFQDFKNKVQNHFSINSKNPRRNRKQSFKEILAEKCHINNT